MCGIVILYKCSECVPIPLASVAKAWATMVGIPSNSCNNCNCPPWIGPLDLTHAQMLTNFKVVLEKGDGLYGALVI